jgi:dipeptidyl aminopeptidase/acylaminoacyl peptidase
MKIRVALLASAIGLSCVASPVAAQQTLAADAKAFGAREAVDAPDLSPDGGSVVYLTPGPGRATVAVVGNLDSGKFSTMLNSDGRPESLTWCNFASLTRAVCRFSGLVKNPGEIDLLGFSRLLALNTDGSNPKLLGQPSTSYELSIRSVDAVVIDWLTQSDGTVLMERLYVPEEGKMNTKIIRMKKGWGVDRVDVTSLRSDPVEGPREAAGYWSDGQGHVRLMSITGQRNSGMLTGTMSYSYRTANSRDWKDIYSGDDREFVPRAVDASANALYALRKKDGRYALYSIKLDGSKAETLIAENPRVDIDDVVRFGDGQKVIGYTYVEDKRVTVYFDPEFKAIAASLSKVLPNLPLIEFVDSSHDGRKLLIFAGSDSDPGRYYVFNRDQKSLTPAMIARPELEGRALANVKPVTISAPDGTAIPAYLTLPPGKAAKGLPGVILPHGGPSSRDEWGFDWLAQFLAARGYAVLQPEYRGSAGFGDVWLNENGFKNWRTSIGDITASAKWLSAQGIADPNKLAILGWSYGGYAALQSAVTEPSLYKAVVAIAPVTDLGLIKQESRNYVNGDLISRLVGQGPHIDEGSPLRHAAAITAPVLLVHGDIDANVRIAESQRMNDALKSAGKQSELLTFAGLDHQLKDADSRTQILTKIGELLDRTIGH